MHETFDSKVLRIPIKKRTNEYTDFHLALYDVNVLSTTSE